MTYKSIYGVDFSTDSCIVNFVIIFVNFLCVVDGLFRLVGVMLWKNCVVLLL